MADSCQKWPIGSVEAPESDLSVANNVLIVYIVPMKQPKSGLADQPAVFHSRLRSGTVPASVSATEAKNEFSRVLETALRDGAVVITRHDAPKAVLLAIDEYQDLLGRSARRLDTVTAEFDALLADLQQPRAQAQLKEAFGADSDELGSAAVEAAAKRRA